MSENTTRDNQHAQIAHAIKSAKRTMFKRHREGMDLRQSFERFISDVAVRAAGIVPDFAADEYQRPEKQTNSTYEEIEENAEQIGEARDCAQVVATFLESGPPDFLMEAVLSAIDNAFEYTGLPKPLAGPDAPCDLADYDKDNLVPLFLKTRLVSWSDMYSNKDRVKDALHTLLHNEATPADLYEAVADFVCEQSSRGDLMDKIYHSEPVLEMLLNRIPADELKGEPKEVAN